MHLKEQGLKFVLNASNVKDKLFHLVESLSLGEIQHFRESARRRRADGSARYLQLFEEILEIVRNASKEGWEAFAKDSTLRVLRHRLFNNLLSSLETFPDYRQAKGGLHSVLRQIEILHAKGIHPPIQRLFEEGVKTGKEIEDFKGVLALYDLYMEVIFESASIGNMPGDSLGQLAEERQAIKALEDDLDAFRLLRSRIYSPENGGAPDFVRLSQDILTHPSLQAAQAEGYRSHSAELLSLQVQFHLKRLLGQFANTASILDRGLELFTIHPALKRDHASIRLHLGMFVYNRGLLAAYQGDRTTARQMAIQLAHFRGHEILLFERLPALNLQIAILEKDWSMAEAVIAEIQAGLVVHRGKITPKRESVYHYQMVRYYLANGKPQLALPSIFELIHVSDEDKSYRNQFAWIFLLIAHLDLGNYDFVIDRLRSTRAYFRKYGLLTEFEFETLEWIKRLAQVGDTPDRSSILDGMGEAMAAFKTRPEYVAKTFYFDFLRWIKAKQQGTTIHSLL